MLHHLVERSAPVVQPQIEACRAGLVTDELLVGGIQSKPHGRELRDLRGQQRNGEVPPPSSRRIWSSCRRLASVVAVSSPSVVEPAGEEEERRLRIERDSPDFTRAAKSRTWFIIP
jgi:hypothetical protein